MSLPTDDAGLERLLRARAPGPPLPPDSAPWAFLLRQPRTLLEGRVWPLVARLLYDDDPPVRLRALELVMTWRSEAADRQLLEVARHHAELFADQRVDGIRLRERLQHAVANRCLGGDAPAIAPLLIGLLDGRPPSPATASVLGAQAPDHAAVIAAGLGDSAADRRWIHDATTAAALYHRDKLPHLLVALRGRPADERHQLAAAADRALERDDVRAARIAAKVGLPRPQRPAPTLEQLRRELLL